MLDAPTSNDRVFEACTLWSGALYVYAKTVAEFKFLLELGRDTRGCTTPRLCCDICTTTHYCPLDAAVQVLTAPDGQHSSSPS